MRPGKGRAADASAKDPQTLFEQSLNAHLLGRGLATTTLEEDWPESIRARVRELAKTADERGAGMWAVAERTVDTRADSFGVLPPWFLRLACRAADDSASPATYVANLLDRNRYLEVETGREVDLIEVENTRLTQTTPLYRVRHENR